MSSADLDGIGRRIQNRRRQLGYTQEQLANQMNVSIQMISNLERGNKAIRIDNLITLSQVLKVSTDYILTGKGSTEELMSSIVKLPERSRKMIEMLVDYCIQEKI